MGNNIFLDEDAMISEDVKRFSKGQIQCIVMLVILFILTIVTVIIDIPIGTVIGVTMESIGWILFIRYELENTGKDVYFDKIQLQQQEEEFNNRKRQYDSDLLDLKKQLEDSEENVASYQKKCVEQETELVSLRERIGQFTETQAINSRKIDELESMSVWGSLLPDIGTKQIKEPVNIISIAHQVVGELRGFAEQAGIKILLSASTDKLMIEADPVRIKIMLRNIVDNSIKYMRKSGTLVITISEIDSDIFIVLKDNGEGLSKAETEHIFELNFQGSNRISGNGLGLTQAKAIVNYYGGTIYARSNQGRGMGIYIQLPSKIEILSPDELANLVADVPVTGGEF